jgi:hypothetical protein
MPGQESPELLDVGEFRHSGVEVERRQE